MLMRDRNVFGCPCCVQDMHRAYRGQQTKGKARKRRETKRRERQMWKREIKDYYM